MGNMDLSPSVEFAENPDPRCACVLLLDTSGSMDGERIKRLNNGLQTSKTQLLEDHMAVKRVDLAIISFDSEVTVVRDFGPLDDFEPPVLTAQYQTFMGTAISEALDKIDDRKTEYKENGIQYYRPWLFLLTDGHPEGEELGVVEEAKLRLRKQQDGKHVKVFPVAVGDGVDLTELTEIAGAEALRLNETKFSELFVWLSASLTVVSHSDVNVGAQMSLPPPNWRTA